VVDDGGDVGCAEGCRVLRRQDPGMLEPTAVIPPDQLPNARDPAAPRAVDLAGKQPVAARVVGRLRGLAVRPGRSGAVDPLLPPGGQVCVACAVERRRGRAGHFAAAAVQLEVAGEAWQIALCGRHAREAAAALRRAGVVFFMRDISGVSWTAGAVR
jgi:hypothetical protein